MVGYINTVHLLEGFLDQLSLRLLPPSLCSLLFSFPVKNRERKNVPVHLCRRRVWLQGRVPRTKNDHGVLEADQAVHQKLHCSDWWKRDHQAHDSLLRRMHQENTPVRTTFDVQTAPDADCDTLCLS